MPASIPRKSTQAPERRISIESTSRRVRAMFNGKTIADSLCAALLLEEGE